MTRPPAAAAAEAVLLRGVSVTFGPKRVLVAVDLRIEGGERVALVGPSGVGKTTLFRLLSGDLAPDRGQVSVLDCDLAKLSPRRLRLLRRDIGHLYQTDALVPTLRVVHNVLLGRVGRWSWLRAAMSLVWPREAERAAAALRAVGLGDRLEAPVGALSGGERQRVAFARLLVQDPKLVLADEPAASLDPRLANDLIRQLLELVRDDGRTVIVSLHQIDLIDDRFDRVVALGDGGIVFDGPPAEFDAAARHAVFHDLASGHG